MLRKKFLKLSRSLVKLFLPLLFKLFIKLKVNRRVINFLNERAYHSNQRNDFRKNIKQLLKNEKITALDVGAQGGFNSDKFFPEKYNFFFEEILIEPIKSEAKKLKNNKYLIEKGLWSEKKAKNLYILGRRPGSSSMFEPDKNNFDIHNIKAKDYKNYKVTDILKVECDTLSNLLLQLNINKLDYLKIDTQGAELEVLKGMENFRPLLIKVEAHIFSMYKGVPSWNKLLDYLYELNYIAIDLKGIGNHNTRLPAEADILFIPNFSNDDGKKIIFQSKEKFLSLMLIFGQINLLKIISRRLNLSINGMENFQDFYFN